MTKQSSKFKNCTYCAEKILNDATKCKHCGEWLKNKENPSKPLIVSARNKKIGIFWLVAPSLSMMMILVIYAISRFTMAELDPDATSTTAAIINIALGFMGIISTLAIIVGIPIGVVYLNKKEYLNSSIQFDQRSGKGDLSEIPNEIRGWNWGAAGLTWLWGISNNVWLALLMFIPYLNIIWWIVLGKKGNEWAWKARPWTSTDEFIKYQKKWSVWGIVIFILYLIPFLLIIGSFLA